MSKKTIITFATVGIFIGLASAIYPVIYVSGTLHDDIDGSTADILTAFAGIGILSLGAVVGGGLGAVGGLSCSLWNRRSETKEENESLLWEVKTLENASFNNL